MVRNSTKNLFAEPKRAAQPFTNVILHAIRTGDLYFATGDLYFATGVYIVGVEKQNGAENPLRKPGVAIRLSRTLNPIYKFKNSSN